MPGIFELTDTDEIGKIKLVSEETPGPQHSDGRFGLRLSERGDVLMPITLTFHIFGLTVTIRINGRNRHSGTGRFLSLTNFPRVTRGQTACRGALGSSIIANLWKMSSAPSRMGGRFFYLGCNLRGIFACGEVGREKPSPMRGRWHGGSRDG